ncbi:MAG TPA: DUF6600 domain-containing protein [Candidatus Polarisedimenticolia bacterium]|nr:DUF6600 domain-containing protein [Candidatus Polarisedimenticolia bacterium]
MGKWLKTGFLAIALVFLGWGGSAPARAADVSFDFFYSNLGSHGDWMVSAEYGQVWQPYDYDDDWNPYYDGHWVYADVGWTWVSDYSWGSIPYHYGTWVLDPDYGWVWVPGYVWAPSWVVFRTGPDYIGWAPVAPSFSVGFSIGYSQPYAGSFLFVSSRDFLAPRVRSCVIPRDRTTVILNRTRIVNNIVVENNIVVNRGPDLRQIERVSGRTIRPVRIEQVRGVSPEGRVSRARLQVDTQRMHGGRGGLRVAEPVRDERMMRRNSRQDRELRNPRPDRDRPSEYGNPRPERDRPSDYRNPRPDRDRSSEYGNPRPERDRPSEFENPRPERRSRESTPHARPYRSPRESAMPEPRSPRVRPEGPSRESASPPSKRQRPSTSPERGGSRGKQSKKPPKKDSGGKP